MGTLKLQKNTVKFSSVEATNNSCRFPGPEMVEWPNQDNDCKNKNFSKSEIERNFFSWIVNIYGEKRKNQQRSFLMGK